MRKPTEQSEARRKFWFCQMGDHEAALAGMALDLGDVRRAVAYCEGNGSQVPGICKSVILLSQKENIDAMRTICSFQSLQLVKV